jgi:two-component system chemotaxis sensor kinase CheA
LQSGVEKRKIFHDEVQSKVLSPLKALSSTLAAQDKGQLDRVMETLSHLIDNLEKISLRDLEPRIHEKSQRTANRLGKSVRIMTEIPDLLIDSKAFLQIIETIGHLVNNGLDHGIEPEEERKSMGKPIEGTLIVKASLVGSNLTFSVKDDGQGISPEGLKIFAVKKGIISDSEARLLTDEQTLQLLVRPGFSTAVHVSDISGRGIGLDAVVEVISRLGGSGLSIQSTIHRGSEFSFTIPFSK